MKHELGVRAHDLAEKKTIEELASIIHDYGFSRIQLVFKKALKDPEWNEDYASRVVEALEEKGIDVAMLGAYFNPVHSKEEVVQEGIDTFKATLRIAPRFPGNPPVGTETGSYNDSPWIYHPKNQTEEGYQATKAVFVELVKEAERVGARIAIESAWGHVIYNVKQHARLIEELGSESVVATVDLFNLLYEGNFEERDAIFHEALSTLGDRIEIIHCKDAIIEDGKMKQVNPGEGSFHYEYMLSEVKKYCPNATLVFEGVRADGIEKSKQHLMKILDE